VSLHLFRYPFPEFEKGKIKLYEAAIKKICAENTVKEQIVRIFTYKVLFFFQQKYAGQKFFSYPY